MRKIFILFLILLIQVVFTENVFSQTIPPPKTPPPAGTSNCNNGGQEENENENENENDDENEDGEGEGDSGDEDEDNESSGGTCGNDDENENENDDENEDGEGDGDGDEDEDNESSGGTCGNDDENENENENDDENENENDDENEEGEGDGDDDDENESSGGTCGNDDENENENENGNDDENEEGDGDGDDDNESSGGTCGNENENENENGNDDENEDGEGDGDEDDNESSGGTCGNDDENENENGNDDENEEGEGDSGDENEEGEGDSGDEDGEDGWEYFCPQTFLGECAPLDLNTTGVPSGADVLSYSYIDEVLSAQCPIHIIRHWSITLSNDNIVTCEQVILIDDTTPPVITINSEEVTSCETLDALDYSVEDCDPNPNVVLTTTVNPYVPVLVNCTGDGYRTQTQGGWGANPNGNNPAVYLYAHFSAAFPQGLTIGCNNQLRLTTPQSITAFLPSGSTPSALPSGVLTNPGGAYNNVLAGQLVAASLSVGFDLADPNFGSSDVPLGELVISSGTFAGWSVNEILALANEVIGGCNSSYTYSQINQVLSSINENFVDGDANLGFLECPPSTPSSECISELEYTITATDACGNSSSLSGSFLFEDLIAPNFEGNPTSITLSCGEEIPAIQVNDDCGSSSVNVYYTESTFSGTCAEAIERIYTAVDACGNASSFTQYIFYQDVIAPIIFNAPENLTVACGESIPVADVIATDNCGEPIVQFEENILGDDACNYTIQRIWTAVDQCGNMTSVNQTIQVIDNVPPVFTLVPTDTTVTCLSGHVFPDPAAIDNCSDVTWNVTEMIIPSSGYCKHVQRIFRAFDACGNMAMAMQNVYFVDDVEPTFSSYPENYTTTCAEILPAELLTASDNCSANVEVTFSEEQNYIECGVVVTRTWTATDECGNLTSHVQTINAIDQTGPVITGQSEVSVNCGDVESLDSVIAQDNCSETVALISWDEIVGSGCEYLIVRYWRATDACGNESMFVQNIHVADTQNPYFTNVPPSLTTSCGIIPPPATPVAFDNCTVNPTIAYTQTVTGFGCNQMITRQWRAFDECGNMGMATQTIQVMDNTPPTIIGVPENISIQCSVGEIPPLPNSVSVEDNCDAEPTLVFSESTIPGNCDGAFTLIRTWTATDICGNASTATQNIDISDTTPPALSLTPADVNLTCGSAMPPVPFVSAIDNCVGEVPVEYFEFEENSACGNIIYRTWMAADACGNTAYHTQVISFVDNVPPVISGIPSQVTINCGESLPNTVPSVSDNCSASVELFYETNESAGGCIQTVMRTWIAMDACGNSATFTQTVSIIDNQDPTWTYTPADQIASCGSDIPVDLPQAEDCSMVNISWIDISEGQVCEGTGLIQRIFTATDACGNQISYEQLLTIEDNDAPALSDFPSDIVVDCNSVPETPVITATDGCDNDVQVSFNEVQTDVASTVENCQLSDAQVFFGDIAVWLPGILGATSDYRFDSAGGNMQVNNVSGTAHVTGTVVNTQNPNQRWSLSLDLANARNWTEWSALGRGYKDDMNVSNGQHVNWTYYELQSTSQLIGDGDFAGSVLQLTHAPSSYYYGVQVGVGANNRNTAYGMSLWFFYNGVVNGINEIGHGDVFSENNCCQDSEIVRTWTATDCSGNTVSHQQIVQISNQLIPAAAPPVESQQFNVRTVSRDELVVEFTPTSSVETSVRLLDAHGRSKEILLLGKSASKDKRTVVLPVADCEGGLYFVQVIEGTQVRTQKCMIVN